MVTSPNSLQEQPGKRNEVDLRSIVGVKLGGGGAVPKPRYTFSQNNLFSFKQARLLSSACTKEVPIVFSIACNGPTQVLLERNDLLCV
jgi:hypothetical protein